ncbi:hypothetical protein YC2023_027756 [Brassica napus]
MDLEPYDPPRLNIIHCVTVKLNEQNFFFWKRQFQSFLSGQRLFGFVTGTIPQPVPTIMAPTIHGTSTPVPNPDHEMWFQTDQVVQSWLLGSITDTLQSMVVNCTTAKRSSTCNQDKTEHKGKEHAGQYGKQKQQDKPAVKAQAVSVQNRYAALRDEEA